MENEYDYLSKIILVGPEQSGKSCLLYRLADGGFNEAYISTIGVDFKMTTYDKIKFQLWDTAGQERFRSITTSYYRGASICMFVIDLSNQDFVDKEIEQVKQMVANLNELTNVILVGSKCDLNGMESSENQTRIAKLREALGDKCDLELEVSAKDNTGIDRLFEVLAVESRQFASRANEGKQ